MGNQPILKEISPGISLEGMMLKLKLQHFGHLMRRVDSLEKTLMLGGIGGRRRRGRQGLVPLRWGCALPLGGTRRVGGLLGVAGRLSGTVSPFRAVRREGREPLPDHAGESRRNQEKEREEASNILV